MRRVASVKGGRGGGDRNLLGAPASAAPIAAVPGAYRDGLALFARSGVIQVFLIEDFLEARNPLGVVVRHWDFSGIWPLFLREIHS